MTSTDGICLLRNGDSMSIGHPGRGGELEIDKIFCSSSVQEVNKNKDGKLEMVILTLRTHPPEQWYWVKRGKEYDYTRTVLINSLD